MNTLVDTAKKVKYAAPNLVIEMVSGQRGQELIIDIFTSCGAQNEFLISET